MADKLTRCNKDRRRRIIPGVNVTNRRLSDSLKSSEQLIKENPANPTTPVKPLQNASNPLSSTQVFVLSPDVLKQMGINIGALQQASTKEDPKKETSKMSVHSDIESCEKGVSAETKKTLSNKLKAKSALLESELKGKELYMKPMVRNINTNIKEYLSLGRTKDFDIHKQLKITQTSGNPTSTTHCSPPKSSKSKSATSKVAVSITARLENSQCGEFRIPASPTCFTPKGAKSSNMETMSLVKSSIVFSPGEDISSYTAGYTNISKITDINYSQEKSVQDKCHEIIYPAPIETVMDSTTYDNSININAIQKEVYSPDVRFSSKDLEVLSQTLNYNSEASYSAQDGREPLRLSKGDQDPGTPIREVTSVIERKGINHDLNNFDKVNMQFSFEEFQNSTTESNDVVLIQPPDKLIKTFQNNFPINFMTDSLNNINTAKEDLKRTSNISQVNCLLDDFNVIEECEKLSRHSGASRPTALQELPPFETVISKPSTMQSVSSIKDYFYAKHIHSSEDIEFGVNSESSTILQKSTPGMILSEHNEMSDFFNNDQYNAEIPVQLNIQNDFLISDEMSSQCTRIPAEFNERSSIIGNDIEDRMPANNIREEVSTDDDFGKLSVGTNDMRDVSTNDVAFTGELILSVTNSLESKINNTKRVQSKSEENVNKIVEYLKTFHNKKSELCRQSETFTPLIGNEKRIRKRLGMLFSKQNTDKKKVGENTHHALINKRRISQRLSDNFMHGVEKPGGKAIQCKVPPSSTNVFKQNIIELVNQSNKTTKTQTTTSTLEEVSTQNLPGDFCFEYNLTSELEDTIYSDNTGNEEQILQCGYENSLDSNLIFENDITSQIVHHETSNDGRSVQDSMCSSEILETSISVSECCDSDESTQIMGSHNQPFRTYSRKPKFSDINNIRNSIDSNLSSVTTASQSISLECDFENIVTEDTGDSGCDPSSLHTEGSGLMSALIADPVNEKIPNVEMIENTTGKYESQDHAPQSSDTKNLKKKIDKKIVILSNEAIQSNDYSKYKLSNWHHNPDLNLIDLDFHTLSNKSTNRDHTSELYLRSNPLRNLTDSGVTAPGGKASSSETKSDGENIEYIVVECISDIDTKGSTKHACDDITIDQYTDSTECNSMETSEHNIETYTEEQMDTDLLVSTDTSIHRNPTKTMTSFKYTANGVPKESDTDDLIEVIIQDVAEDSGGGQYDDENYLQKSMEVDVPVPNEKVISEVQKDIINMGSPTETSVSNSCFNTSKSKNKIEQKGTSTHKSQLKKSYTLCSESSISSQEQALLSTSTLSDSANQLEVLSSNLTSSQEGQTEFNQSSTLKTEILEAFSVDPEEQPNHTSKRTSSMCSDDLPLSVVVDQKLQLPVKRKPGRPRKYPLVSLTSQVNSSNQQIRDDLDDKPLKAIMKSCTKVRDMKAYNNEAVKCATCSKEMKRKKWVHHNFNIHKNLAWQEGEEPVDIEHRGIYILAKVLKVKKKLVCSKCGDTKASAVGYLSHISMCSKTKEEIELLRQPCPICHRLMLPQSLKVHIPTHSRFEYLKKNEKIEDTLQEASNGVRIKRKAAQQAGITMQKVKTDVGQLKNVSEMYSKPWCGVVSGTVKKAWERQKNHNQLLYCPRENCLQSFPNIEEMTKHYLVDCAHLPPKLFNCLECSFNCDKEFLMRNHVEEIHENLITLDSDSDDFIPPEDDDDDDDDDEAGDEDNDDEIDEMKKKRRDGKRAHKKSSMSLKRVPAVHLPPPFVSLPNIFKTGQNVYSQWTEDFIKKNYCREGSLFQNMMCNPIESLSVASAETYLPEEQLSCNVAHTLYCETNHDPYSMHNEWKKYKLFESELVNGSVTLWTGGPVWCLDWTPGDRSTSYVAMAGSRSFHERHKEDTCYSYNNLIQIWNFGHLQNQVGKCTQPAEMVMGLAHSQGMVWDMEWCPSGCAEDCLNSGDGPHIPQRMGLLSVACSDGKVHIYAVPNPDTVSKSISGIYSTDPVASLQLAAEEAEHLGRSEAQATKLCWSKEKGHATIAVGYSNGVIAYFDISVTSPLLRTKRGLTYYFLPFHVFQPYTSNITGLVLVPRGQNQGRTYLPVVGVSSPAGCGLFAGGTELASRRGRFSNIAVCPYWPQVYIFMDELHLSKSIHGHCNIVLALSAREAGVRDLQISISGEVAGGVAGTAGLWSGVLLAVGRAGDLMLQPLRTPLLSSHRNERPGRRKRALMSYPLLVNLDGQPNQVRPKNIEVKHCSISPTKPLQDFVPDAGTYSAASERYGILYFDIPWWDCPKLNPRGSTSDQVVSDRWPLQAVLAAKQSFEKHNYWFYAQGGRSGHVRVSCARHLAGPRHRNSSSYSAFF